MLHELFEFWDSHIGCPPARIIDIAPVRWNDATGEAYGERAVTAELVADLRPRCRGPHSVLKDHLQEIIDLAEPEAVDVTYGHALTIGHYLHVRAASSARIAPDSNNEILPRGTKPM